MPTVGVYSPSAASFRGVPSSRQDDPEISTMDIFIIPVTNNISFIASRNSMQLIMQTNISWQFSVQHDHNKIKERKIYSLLLTTISRVTNHWLLAWNYEFHSVIITILSFTRTIKTIFLTQNENMLHTTYRICRKFVN